MTDLKPPELFSQRPAHMEFVHEQFTRAETARMRSYRMRRILTCAVLAILVAAGFYEIFTWKRGPTEIPTIQAEGVLKQKPEQPGGLDVPNQDVLAYQQIDNSDAKPSAAEHMLPPPETPQQPAVVPAPAPAAQAPVPASPTFPRAPSVENFEAPSVDALAPAPVTQHADALPAPAVVPKSEAQSPAPPAATKTVEVTPSPPAPSPTPAVTASPQPAEDTPGNEEAAPAAKNKSAAKPAATGKKFRVQLASFPDEEEAGHQVAHMQQRYASVLGDAKLHLAKADLGARGIFYRVQSNPISESSAREICAALTKLKAGCIVVRP